MDSRRRSRTGSGSAFCEPIGQALSKSQSLTPEKSPKEEPQEGEKEEEDKKDLEKQQLEVLYHLQKLANAISLAATQAIIVSELASRSL